MLRPLKRKHSTTTDATKTIETTNTLEDRTKTLDDLDPVSNSMNKEGEIQLVQVQGLIFSNNQLHKHQLGKHWLSRISAEEDMGLVVDSANMLSVYRKSKC